MHRQHLCRVSYSEDMVMSQVITGLFNSTHQSKVLNDMTKIVTLQELTERLLTLEATTQASTHFKPDVPLLTSGITTPVRSDYQRNKIKGHTGQSTSSSQNKKPPSSDKCRGCGRERYAKGSEQCPAQGKRCNSCGKLNHFAMVCMNSRNNAIQSLPSEDEFTDVSF